VQKKIHHGARRAARRTICRLNEGVAVKPLQMQIAAKYDVVDKVRGLHQRVVQLGDRRRVHHGPQDLQAPVQLYELHLLTHDVHRHFGRLFEFS
jgi:hypothetical protein